MRGVRRRHILYRSYTILRSSVNVRDAALELSSDLDIVDKGLFASLVVT